MSKKNKSEQSPSKRKAIKSILAGGAVSAGALGANSWSKPVIGSWTKPVINSVVLPAHATMSNMVVPSAGASDSASLVLKTEEQEALYAKVLNTIVPSADAGVIEIQAPMIQATLCVTPNAEGTMADVEVVIEQQFDGGNCVDSNLYEAMNVPVGGSADLTEKESGCNFQDSNLLLNVIESVHANGSSNSITLDSVENGAKGSIKASSATLAFDIPAGGCSLPELSCCRPE